METLEQIKARIEAAVPGARLRDRSERQPVAASARCWWITPTRWRSPGFCATTRRLRLDYCSNVTGVDWLDAVIQEKRKVKQVVEGVEREIEETTELRSRATSKSVYHLYSMELKHGPVILRLRTANRDRQGARAVAHAGLARRRVSGARGL